MADTNRAMELVKNIDRQVDFMFPTFKSFLIKQQKKKSRYIPELN